MTKNSKQSFSVWRQDDNGNRFCITKGLTKEEAVKLAKEFESHGHKQMFWVEEQYS